MTVFLINRKNLFVFPIFIALLFIVNRFGGYLGWYNLPNGRGTGKLKNLLAGIISSFIRKYHPVTGMRNNITPCSRLPQLPFLVKVVKVYIPLNQRISTAILHICIIDTFVCPWIFILKFPFFNSTICHNWPSSFLSGLTRNNGD